VVLFQNYAYLAADTLGLEVVDLTTATVVLPTLGRSLFDMNDLVVADSLLYVVDGIYPLLLVVSLADPAQPLVVGYSTTSASGAGEGVAVANGVAYVADGSAGLVTVDVSTPSAPVVLGTIPTPHYARSVAVSGTTAFVGEVVRGLNTYDVSDPTNPALAGGVDLPTDANAVSIAGGFAYVANAAAGLRVVDVTPPTSVLPAGSVPTPWRTVDVAAAGALGCAAHGIREFSILDLTHATAPMITSTVDIFPDSPQSVAIYDSTHVLIGASLRGLLVVDVADRANPVILSEIAPSTWNATPFVEPPLVYGGAGSLDIVDLTDLAGPALVGQLQLTGSFDEVLVDERGYAFLHTEVEGLVVADVSDPIAPFIVATVPGQGFRTGLARVGQLVYYRGSAGNELHVLDVSDPFTPTLVGSCSVQSPPDHIVVHEGYAYASSGIEGIHVIDVRDPQSPFQVGTLNHPPYRSEKVRVDSGRLYVANGLEVTIYPIQCGTAVSVPAHSTPGHLSLTGGFPNPFRSDVSFRIRSDAAGPVRFEVYDVAGRLVRSLWRGAVPGEGRLITWDGESSSGGPVAAGVYFARLEAGSQVIGTKVVHVVGR
jgi:hypothetical protein